MLNIVRQFTIETVMSDVRKMDYIRLAKQSGYHIYLYFVSTQDVEINIGRVAQRVQLEGTMCRVKIIRRYTKIVGKRLRLPQAVRQGLFLR